MAHAQKPDFVFRAKRTSPFKSAGGVSSVDYWPAEVCASAVVMLDTPCSEVVCRVLATHSILQFPLHFPLPCVTVCHHISTGLYLIFYTLSSWEANLAVRPFRFRIKPNPEAPAFLRNFRMTIHSERSGSF